jgi:type IV fimbrial biogenesis protein FimT
MDAGMTAQQPTPGSRQRGFTLIELMIVVTLLAVMLGIGIPSFRGFIAGQRVKTIAYDFATALLVARSEAIKRNATVTIAPTGSWVGGWTVSTGTTPTILATQQPASNVTITTNPNPTASVVYQGNGRIASSLTFQFSASGTDSVRCVSVNVSGVPNTTTTSCP